METNLAKVKEVAIDFLHLPIEENDKIPGFLLHPFFETRLFPLTDENGDTEFIDIMASDENYEKAVKSWEKAISEATSVHLILMMMRNADKRTFFMYIKDYLSEKDFSILWSDIWMGTEFPHKDINVSVAKMLKFFQQAKMEYMMNKEEIDTFERFPEEVTVYRGISGSDYYKALSWTTDKDIAENFSQRFSDEGAVFQAVIDKRYIYAYFAGESEVIVNYNKLKDIKKI